MAKKELMSVFLPKLLKELEMRAAKNQANGWMVGSNVSQCRKCENPTTLTVGPFTTGDLWRLSSGSTPGCPLSAEARAASRLHQPREDQAVCGRPPQCQGVDLQQTGFRYVMICLLEQLLLLCSLFPTLLGGST